MEDRDEWDTPVHAGDGGMSSARPTVPSVDYRPHGVPARLVATPAVISTSGSPKARERAGTRRRVATRLTISLLLVGVGSALTSVGVYRALTSITVISLNPFGRIGPWVAIAVAGGLLALVGFIVGVTMLARRGTRIAGSCAVLAALIVPWVAIGLGGYLGGQILYADTMHDARATGMSLLSVLAQFEDVTGVGLGPLLEVFGELD